MKREILLFICTAISITSWAGKPTIPTANNFTNTSAEITWENNSCSTNDYTLQYKELSASSWTTIPNIPNSNSTTSYTISALNASTNYEFRVRCGGSWQVGVIFSTLFSSACPIFNTIIATNSSCSNIFDGAINLTTAGGSPPYTYSWDNGSLTKDLTGIDSGLYIVTTTDTAGCVKLDSITIGFNDTKSLTQVSPMFIDTSNLNYPGIIDGHNIWAYDTISITNTGCDVNIRPEFIISHSTQAILQGQIVIAWYSPAGYLTIPYSIDISGNAYGFWGNASGVNLLTQNTEEVAVRVKFQNSAPYGEYTSSWETFEIDNAGFKIQPALSSPSPASISLVNCLNFSIDSTSFSTNCYGGTNGSASILSLTNGSGQYSYDWNNGQNTATAINLVAGNYSCLVTDNNWGCTDSVSININQYDSINAILNGTDITCKSSNDGTLIVITTGGSETYNFNWTPSLPNLASQSNLTPGLYSLTLSDSVCGITPTLSFNINEPDSFQESSLSTNNSSCDTTNCNGSINLSIQGGTSPYSIIWANGDSNIIKNDLCSGSYSITITDANACATFTKNITILDSTSSPNISLISTNISCNGFTDGTAEAIAFESGGVATVGTVSTLSYCASLPGSSDNSNIELVRLVGEGDSIANNTANAPDQYEDYTLQYTTIKPDKTYDIDIVMGVFNSTSTGWLAGVKAFIDWNIDGDFDDIGEEIGTIPNQDNTIPNLNTLTFTVPSDASPGPTRLRVVSQYNNDVFGPCDVGTWAPTYTAPYYGATEDYSIVINNTIIITNATYLWSNGDATAQVTNLSLGTYTCTATDTNNCFSTDSITIIQPDSITNTKNITDVICNSDNNGTVSLIITGGIPPYSSNWGTTDTTALSAGAYNYNITDNNGCTFIDSIYINEPIALSNSSAANNVSGCNGNNNGGIDITPSGGTSPYTFLWSNGDTTEDLTNISAGQYIITITDTNNCTLIDSISISEPDPLFATYSQTNVSCYGENDGNVSFNFFGGTTDYTLSWNSLTYPLILGISSFNTTLGVTSGDYPFTLTDNNSCIFSDTITITEPDLIQTSATLTHVNCNGGNNGIAILNITGGTSPYLENWGVSDSSSLISGYHSFTITDTKGCINNDSILITEPTTLTVSEIITNISCNGLSDGNVILNISGGTSPYIENWGANDSSALATGNNTYTVADTNGCLLSNTILISEPDTLIATAITSDVLCNGDSTGTATLTITGGTAGYFESWNGASTYNLPANTHLFTVTDTNGCIYIDSVIINEPSLLSSTITPTNLTSCLIDNGSVNLNVSGGLQSYSYLWNNNDTTENISDLSSGNYSVIITDNNGCTSNNNTTINQPSSLSLSLTPSNYNGFNISCYNGNNGTITTNTVGGTGNLTFNWSNSDTLQNLSNLSAGNYSLVVTDSIGCSLSDSISLSEPLELSSNYTSTNATCYGLANGSAVVNFNGGIQDYILTWGTYTYPLIGGLSTFITPIGVPAGIYPYTVTDLNGCSQSDTITIEQPDSMYSNLTISNYNGNNISCNGFSDGSIDIQLSGGTTPYTYYFNGSIITNTNITGIIAGIYKDSIIDNNGCIFTETITLIEPTILNSIILTSNISCNGICDGTISTQITGGTSPYTYLWNNSLTTNNLDSLCPDIYNLSLTDNNSCTTSDSVIIIEPSEILITSDSLIHISVYGGSDGEIYTSSNGGTGNFTYSWLGPSGFNATASNISNLTSGTYFLTTIDSLLCSKIDSFTLTQPSSLTANLDSVINLKCNGICTGELNITATGGDSVYTYLWSGPNGYSSTDEDIDSLCAGIYILELSDTTDTVSIFLEITEPSIVTIVSIADTAICYNGTALASAYVYGGIYPYQIIWSNGSNNTSTILPSGIHSVSISDANGCVATKNITIYQPDSISIISNIDSIRCNGIQDGSIDLNIINGGIPPFQYSNNGSTFQNSNSFYNLGAGYHSYTVIDANGCIDSTSIYLNQPSALIDTISTINVTCFGECDGIATITTYGGRSPYSYDWGIANSNNLCAGLYNVTTTDDNGCLKTNAIIINEPNPIIVTISLNGNTIEATSGFNNYQWYDENNNSINGATTDKFSPTSQGEYYVEVIDSNGCVSTSLSVFVVINFINENGIEFNIFPNPTSGEFTIETTKQLNTISILNSEGKRVIILDNNSTFEKQTKIDLSPFTKGLYYIQIKLNNQLINHRIILQ